MEKYNLVFIEQAKNDLKDIAVYISGELRNPTAAEKLVGKIIEGAERIALMPYSASVHVPIKPLKYEYRRIIIDNYMLFYRVDEDTKTVIATRIIYARRNLSKQIR